MIRWLALALTLAACGGDEQRADPRTTPERHAPSPPVTPPAPPPPPEPVPPGDPIPARVPSIAAGAVHTCALDAEGLVQCWGGNEFAQLGDPHVPGGPIAMRAAPMRVEGASDAVMITAGSFHTCIVRADGRLACWGHGGFGQLGDGGEDDRVAPVAPVGDLRVLDVACGEAHTCVVTTERALFCFGRNAFGQLGDGTTDRRLTPVRVPLEDVVEVAAGRDHTCARTSAGPVYCWGSDLEAQIGDPRPMSHHARRTEPVRVEGLDDAIAITGGGSHTCALRRAGTISCWGNNGGGQLGTNQRARVGAPRPTVRDLDDAIAVDAGGGHVCARRRSGDVVCWGHATAGQIGDGANTNRRAPVVVPGLGGALDVSAGLRHTCALLADRRLTCWGGNTRGQVGDGTTVNRPSPVVVGAAVPTTIVPDAPLTIGRQRRSH